MELEPLSPKQIEALKKIYEYHKSTKTCPTIEQLTDLMGLKSRNGVWHHVYRLESKGYVKKGRHGRIQIDSEMTRKYLEEAESP